MTSHRLKAITTAAAIAILLAIGTVRYLRMRNEPHFTIPDENKAGAALLAAKLTGPGYFTESPSVGEDGLWITPEDANAQVDRIVGERKFDAVRADRLRQLIWRLTEPSPSRMVGGSRIPLLRLNLATDGIRG